MKEKKLRGFDRFDKGKQLRVTSVHMHTNLAYSHSGHYPTDSQSHNLPRWLCCLLILAGKQLTKIELKIVMIEWIRSTEAWYEFPIEAFMTAYATQMSSAIIHLTDSLSLCIGFNYAVSVLWLCAISILNWLLSAKPHTYAIVEFTMEPVSATVNNRYGKSHVVKYETRMRR